MPNAIIDNDTFWNATPTPNKSEPILTDEENLAYTERNKALKQ